MKRRRDTETETNQTSSTDTNNQHGMGPVQGSGLGPLQAAAPTVTLASSAEASSVRITSSEFGETVFAVDEPPTSFTVESLSSPEAFPLAPPLFEEELRRYGWSCKSGGTHFAQATFANGATTQTPFVLPPEPCLHRFSIWALELNVGAEPAFWLQEESSWTSAQAEEVPVLACWSLARKHRCVSQPPDEVGIEEIDLPRPRHVGEALTVKLRAGKDTRTTRFVVHIRPRRKRSPHGQASPHPPSSSPPNPTLFITQQQATAAVLTAGHTIIEPCRASAGQPPYTVSGAIRYHEWECRIAGEYCFNMAFAIAEGSRQIHVEVGADPFEVHIGVGQPGVCTN